jgi:CRP/FNR family transcriptional regulator, dissimilatory nitrate respiration regulator
MPSATWLQEASGVRAELEHLAAGDVLFSQGDAATAIYAVESGRVQLTRRTVDDHLVVLHTARAGDVFAEAALFADAYHCDAVAATPSRIWRYPKDQLLPTFRANPDLSVAFMARLARQVQGLRSRLELRNIRSARERVFQHLLLAAGPDGRTVALDGPLQDMAADLGLTREAVYRTLAALEADGVISRREGTIVLRKTAR